MTAPGITDAFPDESPCSGGKDVRIIFYGGLDLREHTAHITKALIGRPWQARLNRQYPPHSRKWTRTVPYCKAQRAAGNNCDEFPFASSKQGGFSNKQYVSLQGVDPAESSDQGNLMSLFYGAPECQPFPDTTPYFVIPVAKSNSFRICR